MKQLMTICAFWLMITNVVVTIVFLSMEMYPPAAFQVLCFTVNCFTFWRLFLDDDDDLKLG